MKIIKKGTKTLPENMVYIGKCHTCGCEFTYSACDITCRWFCDDKVVKCPQCEYVVRVPLIKRKYKGGMNK